MAEEKREKENFKQEDSNKLFMKCFKESKKVRFKSDVCSGKKPTKTIQKVFSLENEFHDSKSIEELFPQSEFLSKENFEDDDSQPISKKEE